MSKDRPEIPKEQVKRHLGIRERGTSGPLITVYPISEGYCAMLTLANWADPNYMEEGQVQLFEGYQPGDAAGKALMWLKAMHPHVKEVLVVFD